MYNLVQDNFSLELHKEKRTNTTLILYQIFWQFCNKITFSISLWQPKKRGNIPTSYTKVFIVTDIWQKGTCHVNLSTICGLRDLSHKGNNPVMSIYLRSVHIWWIWQLYFLWQIIQIVYRSYVIKDYCC